MEVASCSLVGLAFASTVEEAFAFTAEVASVIDSSAATARPYPLASAVVAATGAIATIAAG